MIIIIIDDEKRMKHIPNHANSIASLLSPLLSDAHVDTSNSELMKLSLTHVSEKTRKKMKSTQTVTVN